MKKIVTLYDSCLGANTVLDPKRLRFGMKDQPGAVELAAAVDVAIDDRGLVSLREGHDVKISGNFSSVFCDGGDCFAVQERTSDAAIVKINPDFTTVGVRSPLTKGASMAWMQVGPTTYYSNGHEYGKIVSGTSSSWTVDTYQGPDDDLVFEASVPIASALAFRPGGQFLLVEGSGVWINHVPFQLVFNKARGFLAFSSTVTMLASVKNGFFASDASQTWFFEQQSWYGYRQSLAENAPALVGSVAIDKVDLESLGLGPGHGRLWYSKLGACIGTDSGGFYNLSKENIKIPTIYSRGASIIKGNSIITTAF